MAERVFGVVIKGVDEFKLAMATMDKEIRSHMIPALYRAGVKVQRRAQEIIGEKGHVVTGNLRRSIITEAVVPEGSGFSVTISASEKELEQGFHKNKGKVNEYLANGKNVPKKFESSTGTFVYYAPFVEALPDGGYMLPSFLEKKDEVIKDLNAVIAKAIETIDRKGRKL